MSFKPAAVDAIYAPDPYRSSDHDAVLVGLDLDAPEPPVATCFGLAVTIVGEAGGDVLRGTARRDVILGGDGDDVIDGRGGDDVICGGDGADILARRRRHRPDLGRRGCRQPVRRGGHRPAAGRRRRRRPARRGRRRRAARRRGRRPAVRRGRSRRPRGRPGRRPARRRRRATTSRSSSTGPQVHPRAPVPSDAMGWGHAAADGGDGPGRDGRASRPDHERPHRRGAAGLPRRRRARGARHRPPAAVDPAGARRARPGRRSRCAPTARCGSTAPPARSRGRARSRPPRCGRWSARCAATGRTRTWRSRPRDGFSREPGYVTRWDTATDELAVAPLEELLAGAGGRRAARW